MVPPLPSAALVVVGAQLILELAVVLFHPPATLRVVHSRCGEVSAGRLESQKFSGSSASGGYSASNHTSPSGASRRAAQNQLSRVQGAFGAGPIRYPALLGTVVGCSRAR